MSRKLLLPCLFALGALVGTDFATAAPVTWTVDQPNSSWTWSGNLKQGGSNVASLTQQGAGSLVTTYSGTVVTQSTYAGGVPIQIQITGGTVAAANSGNWAPQVGGGSGTAAANYGGRFNLGSFIGQVDMALRGMTYSTTSGVQPLAGSAGNYNFANGVTLTTTTPSNLDFRTSGPLIGTSGGTAPLSGAILPNTGAANATLVKSAGPGLNATLTIPVNLPGITIPLDAGLDAIFNFAGNIRSTSIPSYLQTFNGAVQADGATNSVNFGSAIVGASLSNSAFSIRNTSPHTAADPSSIQLSATSSATVSPASAAGELAPGANLPLALGINTATAGAKTGVVTVRNLDPLSTDANETFNVSATIVDHSRASFANGVVQTSKTVNLGVLPQGSSLTVNNAYFVQNLNAASGFTAAQDLTSFTSAGNTAKINSNVAAYTNQAAGSANNHNFNVTVDRSATGTFSSSYSMNFADTAMPGATAQAAALNLNLQAQVISPIAVSSVDAQTITRYSSAGVGTVVATAANGLFSPLDVQFDNQGNLYVADNLTSRLMKLDANDTLTTFADFSTGALNPAGLDFNQGTGKLTLSNYLNSAISSYSPPSNAATTVAGPAQGVQGPFDVATDSLGNTYVANLDSQQILKVNSSGGVSVFADVSDGLFSPLSLAVDGSNNVYVADVLIGSIYKFTPAGTGSVFANFSQGVVSPTGMAFDDGGNLMVANYLANNILKITPAGVSSVFATQTLPWGISVFRTPSFAVPLAAGFAAVPEPASWCLMLLGGAALAVWGRRRKAR